MTEPIMKSVKGDGVKINLAVWEGKGDPILCIHGITANCRCWDKIAEVLSPERTIIAMDLRGRGLSDKPATGYSLDHHLKDILCIMDDLKLDRITLMGHSLGAFITLGFAAMHPDRVNKIVLVDGAGDLSKDQMDSVFVGIKPALDRLSLTFPSKNDYVEKMKAAPYMQPWSDYIENYYLYEINETEGRYRTNIDINHILEEAANVRKIDCRSLYPKVKCQTLILKATEGLFDKKDLLLPSDAIRKMTNEIPKSVRFDVIGTNHYGIVFQPHEERDKVLVDFVQN